MMLCIVPDKACLFGIHAGPLSPEASSFCPLDETFKDRKYWVLQDSAHADFTSAAESDAIRARDSKLLECQDIIAQLEHRLAAVSSAESETSKRHAASITSMQHRLDEAQHNADGLSADLISAHERMADAAAVQNENRLKLAQMQHALTESHGTCQHLEQELNVSQASLSSVQQALERSEAGALSAKQELESQAFAAEEKLCDAEASIKQLQAEHQAEVEETGRKLHEAQGSLEQMQSRYAADEKQMSQKLREAESAAASRDQACEQLEHDLAASQQGLAEATLQLQTAQQEAGGQAEQIEQLQQDLDAADQEANSRSVQLGELHRHLEAAKEVNKDLQTQLQRATDEAQQAKSEEGLLHSPLSYVLLASFAPAFEP